MHSEFHSSFLHQVKSCTSFGSHLTKYLLRVIQTFRNLFSHGEWTESWGGNWNNKTKGKEKVQIERTYIRGLLSGFTHVAFWSFGPIHLFVVFIFSLSRFMRSIRMSGFLFSLHCLVTLKGNVITFRGTYSDKFNRRSSVASKSAFTPFCTRTKFASKLAIIYSNSIELWRITGLDISLLCDDNMCTQFHGV